MVKLKEVQYWGALTPEKVAEGVNAAFRNAQELYEEAEILFNLGRFARATSLAVLSVEEVGKVFLLPLLLTATNKQELRLIWKGYRNHKHKNNHVHLQMTKGALQPLTRHSVAPAASIEKWSDGLDDIKQLGFYTDCTTTKDWGIPSDAIKEAGAAQVMKIAANSLTNYRGLDSFGSVPFLEIWSKHMIGMIDMTEDQKHAAFIAVFDEAEKSVLIESGSRDAMEAFLK
jgi:AbiV family abortive infection protein